MSTTTTTKTTLTDAGLERAVKLANSGSMVASVALQAHRERVYGETFCPWPVQHQDIAIQAMNNGNDSGRPGPL